MKFILGRKIGMSQLFSEDGRFEPVTFVEAGPVTVTQVKKTEGKDGYGAVQVGFADSKRLKKPQKGHLKGLGQARFLREFKSGDEYERGQVIDVSVFALGDVVDVSGLSKGKGFAGVVKRHNFKGGWGSHGAKHSLRQPGSIGASWPERVRKGKKMAGRMGHQKSTVKNLKIVYVDRQKNVMALRGAVPGARGTILEIKSIK